MERNAISIKDTVKQSLALSWFPVPRAWLISTAPPVPVSMPRKQAAAYIGFMTAMAAEPSGPQAWPTAMVSTKL